MTDLQCLTETFNALSFDKITGGDREGIEILLTDVSSEVKRLTSAYQTACEECNTLAQVKRERAAELAEVRREQNEHYAAHIHEGVSCSAADIGSLAMQDFSLDRKADLLQSINDCIEFVLSPAAQDRKLETGCDLRRGEHLESGLHCAWTHSTLLEKLERANLPQSHGRIIAYSETVERLKLVTTECHRLAQQADAELAAFRAARLARTQQRHADGQITRADAVFAALELSQSTKKD